MLQMVQTPPQKARRASSGGIAGIKDFGCYPPLTGGNDGDGIAVQKPTRHPVAHHAHMRLFSTAEDSGTDPITASGMQSRLET